MAAHGELNPADYPRTSPEAHSQADFGEEEQAEERARELAESQEAVAPTSPEQEAAAPTSPAEETSQTSVADTSK